MTHSISKHVGLDVHKNTIAVAVADTAGTAGASEPWVWGTIAHRPAEVAKLVKKLCGGGAAARFYYEAGPCGYGLQRQIAALGHDCQVVAPSLIPRKSGDRVKTDRRDAQNLARLGRSGDLTAVWVPDGEQESMRDLTRCREDAKAAERQARQQLSGFLLRHGRLYNGGAQRWTKTFFRWLETLKFESPVQQIVFQEYVDTVKSASERVARLDRQIQEALTGWSLRPVVEGLMALRGVDTVTAVTAAAELGDLSRFRSPRQLMAFLGLVPSEHSSGQTIRRGPITKSGNTHVRRVLIESAWCYRHPARKTRHLQAKAGRASEQVQAIAWTAQVRLCGRFRRLTARGMMPTKVATAIARELSGFIWAIYRQVMNAGAGGAPIRPGESPGAATS